MQWSEVFDKYFIIKDYEGRVLVFIPGTYNGAYIRYAWTTIADIENGVDIHTLPNTRYSLYGEERHTVPSLFKNWRPIESIPIEEKVCRKIRLIEERWKKFQDSKKKVVVRQSTTTYYV